MSKCVYVLCGKGCEWEDLIVFLDREEAVEASRRVPHARVEVFNKTAYEVGFRPTYTFIQNGVEQRH